MPKLFDLRQRGTKEGALTRESGFCFRHLFIFKFFIVTYMFYNLVLLSATHQHESAIGTHMSFPLWASFPFPIPSHPPRLSQSTGLSSLCHTAHSCLLSVLHMVVYMFAYYSLSSSHPLLPPLCPQVCFVCLHLHCCPANRFISTIFLDYIHMH